jgi:hypothetical protein
VYWLYEEFDTDYCLLDGHVIDFENGAMNRWNYRYFKRKFWGEKEKEREGNELP